MPLPSITYTFTSGTVIASGEVNANFTNLINSLTDGTKDLSVLSVTATTFTVTNAAVSGLLTAPGLPPVGSIIPFYDFNAALSFNASYWAYCDGSSQTVSGIGTQTLPDLSNRYLVGFGTEGGGDIDSASWSTSAVGAASHQIDISHTHSTNIGSFSTGSGGSHSHTSGTLRANIYYTSPDSLVMDLVTDNFTWDWEADVSGNSPSSGSGTATNSVAVDGSTSTASDHTHTVDPPATTSSSNLSTTQSIQPRSISVRFIMRIL